jgi:Ca-activated chloride channel family protein
MGSLYRSGQGTEQSSPQQTLETWTEAVKAYDTALQMRADDADSKFNRDFVKRKIDELQRKQNSPQNQQNPQQNQQQKSSQNSGQPPNSGAPPNSGQPPPPQQPPPQPPAPAQQQPPQQQQARQPPGSGQPKPGDDQPKSATGNEGTDQADTPRMPGRITQEEARQLLDSQKGDERRAQGLPFARQESESPPAKPLKDW